jgi:glycosyltransferase involved in cell wall biosynthesis
MEAMAHGVVPVTTDVGGIRYHVRNGENGFLVVNIADEGEIVGSFAALIEQMQRDRALLGRLSGAAYGYAAAHFKGDKFDSYYSSLFMVTQS